MVTAGVILYAALRAAGCETVRSEKVTGSTREGRAEDAIIAAVAQTRCAGALPSLAGRPALRRRVAIRRCSTGSAILLERAQMRLAACEGAPQPIVAGERGWRYPCPVVQSFKHASSAS